MNSARNSQEAALTHNIASYRQRLFPLPGGGGNRRQLIPGAIFFASVWGDVDDLGDHRFNRRCGASLQCFEPSSEIPANHRRFTRSASVDSSYREGLNPPV